MMYGGSGMGVVWPLLVFAVLLPALLIGVGFIATQARRNPGPAHRPPEPGAEAVLADRFARGEIEPDDYEQRLRTLRATRR